MNDVKAKKYTKKSTQKNTQKSNWGGDMPQRTQFSPPNITLYQMVNFLSRQERESLISGYDVKSFARIFEDEDLMLTVDSFFRYDMNVSESARKMYMHRNTLIYRLDKIKQITGFDIRNFQMAITFQILRLLYERK